MCLMYRVTCKVVFQPFVVLTAEVFQFLQKQKTKNVSRSEIDRREKSVQYNEEITLGRTHAVCMPLWTAMWSVKQSLATTRYPCARGRFDSLVSCNMWGLPCVYRILLYLRIDVVCGSLLCILSCSIWSSGVCVVIRQNTSSPCLPILCCIAQETRCYVCMMIRSLCLYVDLFVEPLLLYSYPLSCAILHNV